MVASAYLEVVQATVVDLNLPWVALIPGILSSAVESSLTGPSRVGSQTLEIRVIPRESWHFSDNLYREPIRGELG